MIIKEFHINDLNLHYYIGTNQIKINIEHLIKIHNFSEQQQILYYIFELSEGLQKSFRDSVVQFISDEYILNLHHIFNACYFTQKAFLHKYNISSKKNMEFLLYLSGKRHIKSALEAYGININFLRKRKLVYCIISKERNDIDKINSDIILKLNAEEQKLELEELSEHKLDRIKGFFDINENQIKVILKSYGLKYPKAESINIKLNDIMNAINDLICEKMALLSLENI